MHGLNQKGIMGKKRLQNSNRNQIEFKIYPDMFTEFMDKQCKHSKADDILKALESIPKEDRSMLQLEMKHIKELEKILKEVEKKVEIYTEPFADQIKLLKTIPRINDITAASIIAEFGTDMSRFKSASHLCSWAGMCPEKKPNAGKKKSSWTKTGNIYLKETLTQVARTISRTKNTYLGAKYRSLAQRLGKKRAIVAIGRKILVICYHMLKEKKPFHELGVGFLDNLEERRYHIEQLEELGYHVTTTKK